MKKSVLAPGLWSASAFALPGTGSVDFTKTIVPLLEARPIFKKFVLCSFDIVSDPVGIRIGNIANPHLSGARMGPYSMWADWHSPAGPVKVILTIDTTIAFFDTKGRPTRLENAVRFDEKLDSVEVSPPDQDQPTRDLSGFKYQPVQGACTNEK